MQLCKVVSATYGPYKSEAFKTRFNCNFIKTKNLMRVQRMFLFLTFYDPMCDGEQLHQVLRNKREHVNNALRIEFRK